VNAGRDEKRELRTEESRVEKNEKTETVSYSDTIFKTDYYLYSIDSQLYPFALFPPHLHVSSTLTICFMGGEGRNNPALLVNVLRGVADLASM
jgi:hypothetical protein